MEEWDAQKMLDLYIHDYLVRKNMHTTAEILAKEADIQPKSVVINPPEGFLAEWWSLFWDLYTSRLEKNAPGEQASISTPTENAGPVPESAPPVSPAPDVNYMLQNICPTMGMPLLADLLQTVNPTTVPGPEVGSLLQNAFPPMMPNMEIYPNMFGSAPISNNNMSQEPIMRDLVAEKVREQERLRLPPRSFDNVDQLAHMLPSVSSPSYRKKKVTNKRQLPPVARDVNVGTFLRRSTISELSHQAPKLLQDSTEPADTERKKGNTIPSVGCSLTGFGYAYNIPVSNQPKQFTALPAGCQAGSTHDLFPVPNQPKQFSGLPAGSTHDLAAQTSQKLIISASGSSTKMVSPTLLDDSSKGKGLLVEKNTETEKPSDEDIESFFSTDEAPENMSISLTHTLPQSSSAQKQKEQQDFPFGPVRSLHPTNNKLSCCDFATHGKFFAAGGHEKKVFVWNLKQSNRQTIQAHSQIITDVRFKPNSNIFATSSFDRSVKIWDAANPKKSLFHLVGHAEQVMSVDFHPIKLSLLCSCDCNDEIKLWNVKESTCVRSFQGASRQVRFQPRRGNILAAVTGNVISLTDVESGIIQSRLEGHEKDVRSVCWDVCGEYLVSASQDSTRVWSLVSGGKCIHELRSTGRDFASCTFHPAYSQVVAVGSYQSIYIWNPTMGNRTWNFPAHQGIISAMANAPETNMLASVSHDQWVKLWK